MKTCTRCKCKTFSKETLCESCKIVLMAREINTDFKYMENNKNNCPKKSKKPKFKHKKQSTSCPPSKCVGKGCTKDAIWHVENGPYCRGCYEKFKGNVNAC